MRQADSTHFRCSGRKNKIERSQIIVHHRANQEPTKCTLTAIVRVQIVLGAKHSPLLRKAAKNGSRIKLQAAWVKAVNKTAELTIEKTRNKQIIRQAKPV